MLFFWADGCQVKLFEKKQTLETFGFAEDDRKWLEDFFQEALLGETAIYTLWGSKPVTFFDVDYPTPEMIESMKSSYSQMSDDEKKEYFLGEYNLDVLWTKWERVVAKLPMNNYMFIKHSKERPGIGSYDEIYFINKPLTIQLLREEYTLFESLLGQEFDPEKLVLSATNSNSLFWKFFQNSVTTGILLGFGKENSRLFTWQYDEVTDQATKDYVASFKSKPSDSLRNYGLKLSLKNYPIPTFKSFYKDKDPVVDGYRKERNQINKMYNGQDFVALTLEKLCSSEWTPLEKQ